ncbi:hypothetical protein [Bdellovibrio sp. HCB274]|uniref:hypothetical protein n=1 Tax=Bdellovibrio sp. HCB274 TaxID=3394361 RepID=UPI0039B67084
MKTMIFTALFFAQTQAFAFATPLMSCLVTEVNPQVMELVAEGVKAGDKITVASTMMGPSISVGNNTYPSENISSGNGVTLSHEQSLGFGNSLQLVLKTSCSSGSCPGSLMVIKNKSDNGIAATLNCSIN